MLQSIIEALNRLLDDNRELYIPDVDLTIKPHPEFMIFATQNPAGGPYGGRKLLSRAFRNRFIELYVSELPREELGKGQLGSALMGSLQILVFFARAYLFPQSVEIHYFCSGPINVDRICPQPRSSRWCSTNAASCRPPT